MTGNPVGWFEIYVKDMGRAKAFYEKTFGVKLSKLETPAKDITEMWSFPIGEQGYGTSGALVKMQDGPAGVGGTMVYFECDDCAAEARSVRENGGRIMKDKFSIGQYGFIALGNDSEGNMIGLHSKK